MGLSFSPCYIWVSWFIWLTIVHALPATNLPPQLRPLVIWHGMGDTYDAPGIVDFIRAIKGVHPGIFVHAVYVKEEADEDRKATYFGDVNEQVELVAEQLRNIPELQYGFDAMGFSQGGQFMRAFVERFNSPPVHNLITFGSQHMGVSDLPACKPYDVPCQLARRATRTGVYSEWAQSNVVQAQYFRDQDQFPLYLARNHFLASINNEVDQKINKTYTANMEALNKLVLVLFSKDTMVVPKESSWFGSYAPTHWNNVTSLAEKIIIPMRLQTVYTENRFGLKTLDERDDLIFMTCEGAHMQISEGCWKPLVRKYVGGLINPVSYSQTEKTLRIQ